MEYRKTVLLIDDDPLVLEIISECLRPIYHIRMAGTGAQGLALAATQPLPDLVLLDVDLPDIQGYEVCHALKSEPLTTAIPVIFLSSHSDVADVTRGLELGAVDYVTKPVALPILLARVQTHLRLREARDLLQDQNAHLEHLVRRRTQDLEIKTTELQESQDLTIVALGSIAETRDNETGNHIHRTRASVEALARQLGKLPKFRHTAQTHDWEMIWKFAPLHDIGKVGIPDSILLKPGALTAEEFNIMKRHTTLGRDALRAAEFRVKSEAAFFRIAIDIAYAHHERWNGSGYPEGLSGTAIPLAARLMAVADVYDALINKRVYKSEMSHSAAVDIIRSERGQHFDPELVDCFIQIADEFQRIAHKFSDTPPE